MSNCPVCNTEYIEGQEATCSTCGWNLTFSSRTGNEVPKGSGPKSEDHIQQPVEWAQNFWEKFKELEAELAKVTQERDQYQSLSNQRFSDGQSDSISLPTVWPDFNFLKQFVKEQVSIESMPIEKKISEVREQLEKLQSEVQIVKSKREDDERNLLATEVSIKELEAYYSDIQNQVSDVEAQHSDLQSQVSNLQTSFRERLLSSRHTDSSDKRMQPLDEDQPKLVQKIAHSTNLNQHELRLISLYNNDNERENLLRNAPEVNITQKNLNDIRLGSQKVIFEITRRGSYSIISEEGYHYLFPSKSLRINTFNQQTLEILFDCSGQPDSSKNFQLLKLARVSSLPEGEKWQLEERGILQFL